jgi:hypothetical protein
LLNKSDVRGGHVFELREGDIVVEEVGKEFVVGDDVFKACVPEFAAPQAVPMQNGRAVLRLYRRKAGGECSMKGAVWEGLFELMVKAVYVVKIRIDKGKKI